MFNNVHNCNSSTVRREEIIKYVVKCSEKTSSSLMDKDALLFFSPSHKMTQKGTYFLLLAFFVWNVWTFYVCPYCNNDDDDHDDNSNNPSYFSVHALVFFYTCELVSVKKNFHCVRGFQLIKKVTLVRIWCVEWHADVMTLDLTMCNLCMYAVLSASLL